MRVLCTSSDYVTSDIQMIRKGHFNPMFTGFATVNCFVFLVQMRNINSQNVNASKNS